MPRLTINKTAQNRLVLIATAVNSAMVRRETHGGESYLVVSSATLPDNVIMNGGLYPADEIEKAYSTLEGTHAPLEHPRDMNGDYCSATHPDAVVNGYIIGAKNRNVRRENGRVLLEKWIPERLANANDKGKRLIDRLNALMAGTGEPVHTSTGLLLERETVANTDQGYSWIARNMVFDHDAILLDNPGAATPDDGVGIGVNASIDGEQVKALRAVIELDDSADDVRRAIRSALADDEWLENYDGHTAIYYKGDGSKVYARGYEYDDGQFMWTTDPAEVRAKTIYERVINAARQLFAKFNKAAYNEDEKPTTTEIDPVKQQIIAALNAAGQTTEGKTDDELIAAYNQLIKAGGSDQQIAQLNQKIDALTQIVNAQAESEKTQLVAALVALDVGLSETALNTLAVNELKGLQAKHGTTSPVPGAFGGALNSNKSELDNMGMPE